MLEDENRLIPQWAIAVIVIGVGGLLFIIIFGVSVVSPLPLFHPLDHSPTCAVVRHIDFYRADYDPSHPRENQAQSCPLAISWIETLTERTR